MLRPTSRVVAVAPLRWLRWLRIAQLRTVLSVLFVPFVPFVVSVVFVLFVVSALTSFRRLCRREKSLFDTLVGTSVETSEGGYSVWLQLS